MRPHFRGFGPGTRWLAAIALATAGAALPAAEPRAADPRGLDIFVTRLRELLAHRCAGCHGATSVENGFDMSTRESLLAGGASGPAVVPGDSAASLLYRLAARLQEPHMPEEGDALTADELKLLAEWIDRGAPFDKPLIAADDKGPWTARTVPAEARDFWAFKPLAAIVPPTPDDPDGWCRNPIDRFILARQQAAGISPSPAAPAHVLIRRLALDLTGLPPAPTEVAAFVTDPTAARADAATDALLSRPAFGERWAQHWLDVARFAESFGYEQDYDRPHAHHYRDFVIRAFNEDLPYDTFLQWQLAGDELAPDEAEARKATGFLAAGAFPTQLTEKEFETARYSELDDMAATTGTAMLGLTIGCARCHDHKFDPLPQADYYRLVSTFTTTIRGNVDVQIRPEAHRAALAAWQQRLDDARAAREAYERDELPRRFAAWADGLHADAAARASAGRALELLARAEAERTAADRAELERLHREADEGWKAVDGAVRRVEAERPQPEIVKVLVAGENVPRIPHHADGRGYPHFYKETHYLRRGDVNQKDGVAEAGFLQVLSRHPSGPEHWRGPAPAGATSSHRRAALARWVTDVDSGAGHLAARVIVNRLWQHHFGTGLVATPSDFGHQGEPPSHPELLDWLAGELIRGGWRLKPIHRLMVTSATYRQSSAADPAKATLDPANRLLWRFNRRRLEGEAIRDTLLALAGSLDPGLYGRAGANEATPRRSLYLEMKRSRLPLFLRTFDSPDFVSGLAKRSSTTTAPQALFLMNSPITRAWAEAFAKRIAASAESVPLLPAPGGGPPDAPATPRERVIQAAFATALARSPGAAELEDAERFIVAQEQAYAAAGRGDAGATALTDCCQVLMGLNETLHIE